ncbi:hypothetical protein B0T17DRAFT_653944 [Bombardia bombarda]|uniref:Protein kinase domain-containing protein n=1 Tax=Bombardia bombarda TaxID=252184 RepID=A0AA40C9L1_9PEZI|nr:hypothetical protein B0T17DRAFT_653944 [Bombardia bombarda]
MPSWLKRRFRGASLATGSNAHDGDLVEVLYEKHTSSKFANNDVEYWPRNIIHDFITEETVRHELSKTKGKPKSKEDVVKFILEGHGRMLFTLAVVTAKHQPDKMLEIMRFFMGQKDRTVSPEVIINEPNWLIPEDLKERDRRLWNIMLAKDCCEYQWKVLVPIFSTEQAYYNFGKRTILPFTSLSTVDEGRGGFSKVHQVEIQPGHFDDPSRSRSEWPKCFAVKEIIPPDAEERQKITQSFGNEARTLKKMNNDNSTSNHIIRFITAFTMGNIGSPKDYYLIFEWADGGSLEDLFSKELVPVLSGELVKHVAVQLRGLAGALKATHDAGIRHGDLKPGNILRFCATEENIIGTLKIGDWGLARYHSEATVLRKEKGHHTTTRYGTPFYEPPEVELNDVKLLGRQYDVWSMGCIILEIMIWLLYNHSGVQQFHADVKGDSKNGEPCYECEPATGTDTGLPSKAKLRPIVLQWMDYIEKEPICDQKTALGALLTLVKNSLLVVELPKLMGETRETRDIGYLDPSVAEPSSSQLAEAQATPRFTALLQAPTVIGEPMVRGLARARATSEELVRKMADDILDDEDRSEDYWLSEGLRRPMPSFTIALPQKLLSPQPSSRQVATRDQRFLDNVWDTHLDNDFASKVLSRIRDSPTLSLPKLREPANLCSNCQKFDFFSTLGFAVEYSPGELKALHPNCQASDATPKSMPIRVINVGRDGDESVRLWKPSPEDKEDYIALSYSWGHQPYFVTTVETLKKHMEGINIVDLPATFRDAIAITRALGKRYLWIDGLCIIQGPGGDFHLQAKSMETVFSSAYCVLAASRAHHQANGFLGPRRERDYVTIKEKGPRAPRFYICENIDNF